MVRLKVRVTVRLIMVALMPVRKTDSPIRFGLGLELGFWSKADDANPDSNP